MCISVLHLVVLAVVLSVFGTFANKTTAVPSRRFFYPTHHRNGAPYGIKMPYPKFIQPNPSAFSHSVAWKTKQPTSNLAKAAHDDQPQQDLEVTQFHSQDTNGQVIFGFNSPDQMRLETRNSDGSVHGTYSYVDPYGHIIKRQYWDNGAGFHVTSNSYPLNNAAAIEDRQSLQPVQVADQPQLQSAMHQFTPEVQAARDVHFQLYQKALSSVLPKREKLDENRSLESVVISPSEHLEESVVNRNDDNETFNFGHGHSVSGKAINNKTDKEHSDVHDEGSNNNRQRPEAEVGETISLSKDHNGTIVIENPEFLRISWATDSKRNQRSGKRMMNLTDTALFINNDVLKARRRNGSYINRFRG